MTTKITNQTYLPGNSFFISNQQNQTNQNKNYSMNTPQNCAFNTTNDFTSPSPQNDFVINSNTNNFLIPTVFQWDDYGKEVYLTGSFCEWRQQFKMYQISQSSFQLILSLPRGIYQYKFIVDGAWAFSKRHQVLIENGNVNNIVDNIIFINLLQMQKPKLNESSSSVQGYNSSNGNDSNEFTWNDWTVPAWCPSWYRYWFKIYEPKKEISIVLNQHLFLKSKIGDSMWNSKQTQINKYNVFSGDQRFMQRKTIQIIMSSQRIRWKVMNFIYYVPSGKF